MSPQSVCVCKCVCFCVRVRDLVAAPRHSEAVRRRGDLDGGLRARRPPSTCRRFAVVRPKSKPRGIACVRSAGAACAACSACSDDDGFAFAAFALVSRWQPIQRRKGRDQGSSVSLNWSTQEACLPTGAPQSLLPVP
ncbi:uncharacterized protein LOC117640948 isoform X2 [Thrips palmi]|uniref:Uncharacterized protein LOC117640948 isoform X2 n=1 Tax=Thrips palmi TaxID=161013 RepID=A0A6P8Y315_THRPL|nr:uncharacterized protein LOC117640948 isoform X2 [Thrips palmi]